MEKVKEYLKMADMFELPINDDDRKAAVDLFSHMVTTPYSVDYTVTMSKYAAHAINSHDELVEQRDQLLEVLEAVLNCGRGSSGRIILNDFDEQCLVTAITKVKGGTA